jgi:hypothetical protein
MVSFDFAVFAAQNANLTRSERVCLPLALTLQECVAHTPHPAHEDRNSQDMRLRHILDNPSTGCRVYRQVLQASISKCRIGSRCPPRVCEGGPPCIRGSNLDIPILAICHGPLSHVTALSREHVLYQNLEQSSIHVCTLRRLSRCCMSDYHEHFAVANLWFCKSQWLPCNI